MTDITGIFYLDFKYFTQKLNIKIYPTLFLAFRKVLKSG